MRGIQSSQIDDIVKDEKIIENPSSFLLNRSWRILDDDNKNEIVIFRKNNSLLYSNNGTVEQCTWEYLPVNKTIVLNLPSISYMLLPFFYDDIIFFKIYSTCQYLVFMSEQSYIQSYGQTTFVFNSFIESVYNNKQEKLEGERIRKQREYDMDELRWQLNRDVRQEMEKYRFYKWCSDIDLKTIYKVGFYIPIVLGWLLLMAELSSLIFLLFDSDIADKIMSTVRMVYNQYSLEDIIVFGNGFWWQLAKVLFYGVYFLLLAACCGALLCVLPFILVKIGKQKENRIRKQLLSNPKYKCLR